MLITDQTKEKQICYVCRKEISQEDCDDTNFVFSAYRHNVISYHADCYADMAGEEHAEALRIGFCGVCDAKMDKRNSAFCLECEKDLKEMRRLDLDKATVDALFEMEGTASIRWNPYPAKPEELDKWQEYTLGSPHEKKTQNE